MKIGSLCSGYGGIDLAVEKFFGATTAWNCEWEAAPSKILAHHWNVPNHHDLTATDWDAVEPVDILTGGYPCQPFSAAGQRKGTDDERHLWPHVREAIRRLRPRLTLLENVAGHRSLGFDRVLGDCAEDGLSVRWVSLRASDVGAPHGRERLFFVVTDPTDQRHERPGPARFGRNGSAYRGHTAANTHHGAGNGQWPRAEFGQGSAAASHPCSDRRSGDSEQDSGAIRSEVVTSLGDNAHGCRDAASDAESVGRREGRAESARLVRRPHAAVSGDTDWGIYEPAIRRWEHNTERRAPAPTEPGRNGPRLSPLLVEWMMGLPAGWVTSPEIGLTRNEQLKALGNGVVPQQAAEALRRLRRSEVAT